MLKIRKFLTKKILKLLEIEKQNDLVTYTKWFKKFGNYLKEGLHTDKENQE